MGHDQSVWGMIWPVITGNVRRLFDLNIFDFFAFDLNISSGSIVLFHEMKNIVKEMEPCDE